MGGAPKVASKITLTARALSALASYPESDLKSMERGFDYLYGMYQSGLLFRPEPIGFILPVFGIRRNCIITHLC
mgnify:CR=1 FL=1